MGGSIKRGGGRRLGPDDEKAVTGHTPTHTSFLLFASSFLSFLF